MDSRAEVHSWYGAGGRRRSLRADRRGDQSRWTRRSLSRCRSPKPSKPRTSRASSTATSSRRTSSSPTTARSRCSTSASPRRGRPRPATRQLSLSPTMTRHATNAGVILGTAAYMSPEQARGKKVDRRADIWAFGVVLWEMLTGRKLFEGETVSDVLASVLKETPSLDALPSELPPSASRVVYRCLERDPRLGFSGSAMPGLNSREPRKSLSAMCRSPRPSNHGDLGCPGCWRRRQPRSPRSSPSSWSPAASRKGA